MYFEKELGREAEALDCLAEDQPARPALPIKLKVEISQICH